MNNALDRMKDSGAALLAALGGRDPAAIDAAVVHYRHAIESVRASGAWHATPALAASANELLDHVGNLTERVRRLTQVSAGRLAALEAAGAALPRGVYDRQAVRS